MEKMEILICYICPKGKNVKEVVAAKNSNRYVKFLKTWGATNIEIK